MGGAATRPSPKPPRTWSFQSQGRFFGGCCIVANEPGRIKVIVSIAGAILWGVLPDGVLRIGALNRVSIAGAILWGVLLLDAGYPSEDALVSIAGAILWGVLRKGTLLKRDIHFVSIAGAILWGVLRYEIVGIMRPA